MPLSSPRPVDSKARAQALDPTTSFAVTAPAGSGKTGLLTQRMLTLLQSVEHPEELLAITFTKKAACEMQERILLALEAAEQPQPEDAHQRQAWQLAQQVLKRDAERGWQLKHNPQRLRIQTIDGLCRRIAAELPFASALGAMPQPLEDADGAYREAVQNLFLSADEEAEHSQLLAQLFTHMDNNLPALESLCVALLQKREQWLAAVFSASGSEARQMLEHTLRQIIGEHLQQ
ncbi:MAG TPA: UvrD-helicase domain-containing protein, partial [Cellvibrionaceae bacterium]